MDVKEDVFSIYNQRGENQMFQQRKVVIIGAGHVGSHCALSLAMRGTVDEIVFIDINQEKARSHALDIADAALFMGTAVKIRVGDYTDCHDASLIVLSIGMPRKPGQTRLDMLGDSIRMLQDVIRHLKPVHFEGILITITNPADIIAYYTRKHLGLSRKRCFSTGTSLDTARLRRTIGKWAGVDPRSVSAFALGEHGNSAMIPFSAVTIGGKKYTQLCEEAPDRDVGLSSRMILEQTRQIGNTIIDGKGSTEFGIGLTLADMVQAIFHDERRILPASVWLEGEYAQQGVQAGVPCILGREGIEEIVQLPLTQEEQEAFNASCAIIRQHMDLADQIRF